MTRDGSLLVPSIPAEPSSGLSSAYRIARLWELRESSKTDHFHFLGLVQRTYAVAAKTSPVLAALIAVGLEPLRCKGEFVLHITHADGSVEERVVPVERRREGSTVVTLFWLDDELHLWCQASAARLNAQGLNDFTTLFIGAIDEARPVVLEADSFSRLLRDESQAARLMAQCDRSVDVVVAGGVRCELRGPNASQGRMLFNSMAMMAAWDRQSTVTRLICGKIAAHHRGWWMHGPRSVPVGSRYDKNTRGLVLVPALRPVVDELLLVLAEGGRARRMVDRLTRLGVEMERRVAGARLPLGATQNPGSMIAKLYAWSPTLLQGEYLYRHASLHRHVDDVIGMPIARHPDVFDDEGELQMLCRVDLPEGGYATEEVRAAVAVEAMARSEAFSEQYGITLRPLNRDVVERSADATLLGSVAQPHRFIHGATGAPRGGRAKSAYAPLAGRTWESDGALFEMRVQNRSEYVVYRWPTTPDAQATELGGLIASRDTDLDELDMLDMLDDDSQDESGLGAAVDDAPDLSLIEHVDVENGGVW